MNEARDEGQKGGGIATAKKFKKLSDLSFVINTNPDVCFGHRVTRQTFCAAKQDPFFMQGFEKAGQGG